MSTSRVSSRRIVTGLGTSGLPISIKTTTTPVRKVIATRQTVDNPDSLVRYLNTIQDVIEETTLSARSSPENGAIIHGPFTASSQLLDINHGLNRSPVSVTCARAIGAAWTGYEVTTDIDPKKQVRIQFPAAGTFYLRFA